MEEHKCDAMSTSDIRDHKKMLKEHNIMSYGNAIGSIIKVGNKWFAYNDEYAAPIVYCPFCGKKL